MFSQIIKNLVRKITYEEIINYDLELIRGYMEGIIAGESCVEINKVYKKYRVHISANIKKERDIYQTCLHKIGITCKQYTNNKDIIISRFENNLKLLEQRLMCLSPEKYNKFLHVMRQYPNINEESDYFTGTKKVWNKVSADKIDMILEFYKNGIIKTKEIADRVGVSTIKVNRVLKENNLGKRQIKTLEPKRKEIAMFSLKNEQLTQKQIAEYFKIHESVVRRACNKYNYILL